MCTVLLCYHHSLTRPLVLAANRDENLARTSFPTSLRRLETMSVVAPQDAVAGGSWIGVNASGVVVAITNRFGSLRNPALKSRGELVDTALLYDSAEAARHWATGLVCEEYNPFHLLVADEKSAFCLVGRHEEPVLMDLNKGVHVITERSFTDSTPPRETYFRSRIGPSTPNTQTLKEMLSDLTPNTLDSPRISIPEFNYGTRSGWILELGPTPQLHVTESAPTPDGFEDRTPLLHQLLGR